MGGSQTQLSVPLTITKRDTDIYRPKPGPPTLPVTLVETIGSSPSFCGLSITYRLYYDHAVKIVFSHHGTDDGSDHAFKHFFIFFNHAVQLDSECVEFLRIANEKNDDCEPISITSPGVPCQVAC
jgi:hypothetical protein